ncbi:hypothetical protein MKX03_029199 [Papaver bracteatum]|nr:hypothetical protein MKX03_029199 [Papaver bracteatum]
MTEIDHYAVLGLPSGEKGAKLTQADIKKAYRTKALELHPDKCPDDPNANTNFQKLQSSFDILRDEIERKRFDDLLRSRAQDDSTKFGQMMAYYHDKVVAYFCPPNPDRQVREEEERCRKQLREALAKLFRTLFNLKRGSSAPDSEPISSSPDSDKLAREKLVREVEVDICVELALVGLEIMTVIGKIILIGIAAGKRYYQAAASIGIAAGKRYYRAASSFYSEKGLDMFFRFRKRVQVD